MVASDYLQQVQTLRRQLSSLPAVWQQLDAILRNDHRLKQGQLPLAVPELTVAPTLFLDLFQLDPTQPETALAHTVTQLTQVLDDYREYLASTYGIWSHTTPALIADLARLPGKRYLEIMAGNGYISAGLRHLGQMVIATDTLEWVAENETGRQLVTAVQAMDALTAVRTYGATVDYIVMSWSPDGVPIDWQVLQLIRQCCPQVPLLCIGEKDGCTGSSAFWQGAHYRQDRQVQQLNRHFAPFDLVQEQVFWVS
ncbi:hypothetical protein [Loigolactobacillus bifermentans]|uniref:SAM-dependent methyltransferase n=1 Tax=Loigolactobacillus bifermentans DSM 20003 TaxID=1423726 RepID=A0A0R1H1H2_9LACO|nr:hypothetical protein [Loigolactobacillus bifermentans]KRK40334.1 SAM-dependent methyltransferase [Loigolactobacillus bifermentans DSM 20003]QGG59465.1 SAM-dependent methyltransferase [Loigolactobacillus bifermentans]